MSQLAVLLLWISFSATKHYKLGWMHALI